MTLDQATNLIKSCTEQMNARYQNVVFDEWAIVSLSRTKGRLLAYAGPRKEGFQRDFLLDAGPLRTALFSPQYPPGDFEFARHGFGPAFEGIMALGGGLFLIWNNTVQCMDGITKDPRWLGAQAPLLDLSDRFRADALVLA
jgi:hypothetical protein